MHFYGSASAEPFFAACFSGERGSTTAHLRRLPRKGRAGGAQNLCSSIACRAQPCQRCSPVLQALIYLSMHFYGSASAEPFFAACFSGERGSTTAHLRRLPRKGRAGGAQNLCSSIACRAQPCQRCSPVLQALIIFQMQLYGSASAEPFFVAHFSGERRRLLIFAQASRVKTKSMVLRLFCKLFVNPIDKAGGQEYIFSSRADRVLKAKQTAPREVCKTMKKNIDTFQSRLCRRWARSC